MTENRPFLAALDDRFLLMLGYFHAMWATLDLALCYGIGKFLGLKAEECHVLTSGMEFGRKLTLLRNLVYRSDHLHKTKIMALLGKIQNESKRNVFAHSFIISDQKTVTFIERSRGGDYKVTRHNFTLKEFYAHVESLGTHAEELTHLIVPSYDEFQRFAEAALNAETKVTKSPVPPNSKA